MERLRIGMIGHRGLGCRLVMRLGCMGVGTFGVAEAVDDVGPAWVG